MSGRRAITEPVPTPKRKAGADASCSDDDREPVKLGSDVDKDEYPVVDTDEESDTEDSDTSSDVSVDLQRNMLKAFLHTAPVMSTARKPQATGDRAQRRDLPPL